MKKKPPSIAPGSNLHRQAEARYGQRHEQGSIPQTTADILRLVHELQVHQIELEIQNEELQRSRAEIEAGLKRYTELYDFAPVGYVTLSADGTIYQANLYLARLLRMERDLLMGVRFGLFVQEDDRVVFNAFLESVFGSKTRETCELALQKGGYEPPTWVYLEAIATEDRQECRTAVLDVTARKLAEIKLQYVSMHDALTGLYNRAYFIEAMRQLEGGRHFPVSILMADVDHLKLTNDHFGHAAGDGLLIRTAQVLLAAFRAEDIVARIGGDEFAVLLPETDAATTGLILKRFSHILLEHNSAHPDLPLQLTLGQFTAESSTSLHETLKEADANMYRKKRERASSRG